MKVETTLASIALIAGLLACAGRPDQEATDSALARNSATEDAVDRGRYLVEGLLQCFICHSERDWSRPGAPPAEHLEGAGRVASDDGAFRLVTPNLTPDDETGIGQRTDDELARAIRQGIGHDGRVLSPRMWYNSFRHLTDVELGAVMAYLRSRPAIVNPLPATLLPPDVQAELNARSPRPLMPLNAATADPLERGRALVALADCEGCHTAWEAPGESPLLAGGNRITRGEHTAFSTNITPDPSGVAYDADTFIEVIRTGKHGVLSPIMPWIAFRNLADEDLRAIHTYLHSMRPVAHFISNGAEPSYCAVCGQMHGLGAMNTPDRPTGILMDPATNHRYVGIYYNEHEDFRLEITGNGNRLLARVGGEDAVEPTFLSPTRIFIPGEPTLLELVIENGRTVRIRTVESAPIVLERTDSTALP